MTYQDTQFQPFAGQLVANGIGTNMPIAALEAGQVASINQTKINSLSPKIKDIFIRETRIFENPIQPYVTVWNSRFGVGVEQAMFKVGSANSKLDGTCMPWGNPEAVSQTNVINFAYSTNVSVYDHEVDMAVLDEGQMGAYVAQKLRTPLKTIGKLKYRSWVQLLSDVVDGTRSIGSDTSSDEASTDITYNPTITGYAGKVYDSPYKIPAPERGSAVTIGDAETALALAQNLQAVAADFKYEGDDYNKLGADTFSTGVPLLFMEQKVLDGLDAAMANANAAGTASTYGYAGFPTVSFREFVSRFCEIVQIDNFASLPTGSQSTNNRLGAVLMDRDALLEKVSYADVESFRCAKERATGYNYQGSSALCIWQGANSYAVLFDTAAAGS